MAAIAVQICNATYKSEISIASTCHHKCLTIFVIYNSCSHFNFYVGFSFSHQSTVVPLAIRFRCT